VQVIVSEEVAVRTIDTESVDSLVQVLVRLTLAEAELSPAL
jgi:hypothetical protein